MDRAEKIECVSSLTKAFFESASVIVAHNLGLTAMQMNNFRTKMAASGGAVKVSKNKLVKLAAAETDVAGISDLFSGPTVLAYAGDPMVAPKVAFEFAKQNEKFVILGGVLGKTVLNAESVKMLAELPSLDVLRGRLIGILQAPQSQIARIVCEPGARIARLLGNREAA